MTDLMHYEKGWSPSAIQRKYSLTYVQGYELAERLKKTQELELEVRRENAQLKELLKECELWFTGVVGNMNDKNVGEHNRNLPIGNFEHAFKVFSQKISQALGEDK